MKNNRKSQGKTNGRKRKAVIPQISTLEVFPEVAISEPVYKQWWEPNVKEKPFTANDCSAQYLINQRLVNAVRKPTIVSSCILANKVIVVRKKVPSPLRKRENKASCLANHPARTDSISSNQEDTSDSLQMSFRKKMGIHLQRTKIDGSVNGNVHKNVDSEVKSDSTHIIFQPLVNNYCEDKHDSLQGSLSLYSSCGKYRLDPICFRQENETPANENTAVPTELPMNANEQSYDGESPVSHSGDDMAIDSDAVVVGRRMVDLNSMLKELRMEFSKHRPKCQHPFIEYKLLKYVDRGLKTQLFFECKKCDYGFSIWTTLDDEATMGMNESAVIGSFTAGVGCYALQEILAAMDIPSISQATYGKYRNRLFELFRSVTEEDMKRAAALEKEIAIKAGNVIDGIPYIKVVTDGSWPKRSYAGGKHDALSGTAFIIGHETQMILFVGVRNKYCWIHAEAERLNKEPPSHVCFKNWSRDRSSTAMESDIIVEGFTISVKTHGLIYETLISDRDSSTIQAIRNAHPYAEYGIVVRKIECNNHLFRNLCKKLKEAAKMKITATLLEGYDISVGNLRKRVISSGMAIRCTVKEARDLRCVENISHGEKSIALQKDILTIFNHTFGDHSKCEALPFPCESDKTETNLIPLLEATSIFPAAFEAVRYLSCHAESLLHKVTNNIAESANSIGNKLISGKRINYCASNSYEMRVYGTAVQHNSQSVLSKLFVGAGKRIPAAVCNMEGQRQQHVENNRIRRAEQGRHKPRRGQSTDKHYGPLAEKPDLPKNVYETLAQDHFEKLSKHQANREKIERDTVSQSDCQLWHNLRTMIITASHFGQICRMLKTTSCANTVASIRYPKVIDTPPVHYGISNEGTAKDALELKLGKKIMPCGLFIDSDIAYLGASPDGLIDTDGIVEIKCPFSAKDMNLQDAICSKKNLRSIFDKKDMNQMSRNHKYFYQVQGQLHITKRSYCIFALWNSMDSIYLTVLRDDEFWCQKMEPQLKRFYMDCLLPEIVDGRRVRSLPIRDPEHIEKAREEAKRKKEQVQVKKRKRDEDVEATAESNSGNNEVDSDSGSIYQDHNASVAAENGDSSSAIDHTNTPWSRIEMPDDMEATEEGRQVLEAAQLSVFTDEVIVDILRPNNLLNDTSIDFFQLIVQEHSEFQFHPASYTGYHCYIEPCMTRNDMQIIGGNRSEHWCCVHFNGSQVNVYDSIPKEYNGLHFEMKRYIKKRYPFIPAEEVIIHKVTNQPDTVSCGIYAAAFATSVALGENPSNRTYSLNVPKMRSHLVRIVRNRTLVSFPEE